MITIDRPTTVIEQLPSIDLDELVARAALLTRLDRKYVLTTGQLDEMLRALPSGVQALEIGVTTVTAGADGVDAVTDIAIAAGSAGMAGTPSADSAQGWVAVVFDQAIAAGTELQVTDADGKVLATFVTAKSTQSLVVSAAGMANGEEYSVLIDGTPASTVTAGEGGGMTGGRGGGPR